MLIGFQHLVEELEVVARGLALVAHHRRGGDVVDEDDSPSGGNGAQRMVGDPLQLRLVHAVANAPGT